MKLKWGDFLIIGIILVVMAAIVFVGSFEKPGDDSIAQISVDGDLVLEINLDDLSQEKQYFLLDGEVELLAKEGMIRFIHSDCPDLVCVNTGWISRSGQVAACLPNKVIIKIVGKENEMDVVLH